MVPDLDDESWRAREFPVAARAAFLAHAAVSPLPRRVADAIATTAATMAERGQFGWLTDEAERRCRTSLAALLGVERDEIALTSSTSAGLATVAAGWRLSAGDEVLITPADFPSVQLAWSVQLRRGVRVRCLRADPRRPLTADAVLNELRAQTRVVSISTANWLTGAPAVDLCRLGAELRARGVRLVLDAAQTAGVGPVCGVHADVVVADGHKWLLGPQACGVLMIRRHVLDEIDPVITGWRSTGVEPGFSDTADWAPGARRYESGSLNALGIVGLDAALGLLAEHRPAIALRVAMLRRQLIDGLRTRGHDLLADPEPDWSPIVTFRPRLGSVAQVQDTLVRADVIVSVRQTADGRDWLRAAPHFYNTAAEVDRLLDRL